MHRSQRLRVVFPSALLAAGLALLAAGFLSVASPGQDAHAIAACVSHTNTAEEATFNAQLQAWRNTNVSGSLPMTPSAPLNAAAYGYAVFLANTAGAGGHNADGAPGFAWSTRAIQCGYPAAFAAGGEGLAVVESSGNVAVGPSDALAVMAAEAGGGIHAPIPAACIGTGKATGQGGKKVAWVTLIFYADPFTGVCPQAVTAGPPATATATGSASATASATATRTATATPTPTQTPSPTPQARFGVTITIPRDGWTLVTLPAGPIADVLARARGCYVAVYQLQGDEWRRYSPEAPAYALNLGTSNGGVFWIKGGSTVCGPISL
ncbi:MAG: hypothetical protein ACKVT1_15005 [Dehalococcoidia bacterium]